MERESGKRGKLEGSNTPMGQRLGEFNFDAKSLLCERRMQYLTQKISLRKKKEIFDAKSLLCEGRMQYLMQEVCFAKEECNI